MKIPAEPKVIIRNCRAYDPQAIRTIVREGLEELNHIHRTGAERIGIDGHGPVRDAVDGRRIDASVAQVLLQTHPRRRHLAHRGETNLRKTGKLEVWARRPPDQKERIAGDHLAKTDKAGVRMLIPVH